MVRPLPRVRLATHQTHAVLEVFGGLSKLWSLFGSPKLGPVLGPVLWTIILTVPHFRSFLLDNDDCVFGVDCSCTVPILPSERGLNG